MYLVSCRKTVAARQHLKLNHCDATFFDQEPTGRVVVSGNSSRAFPSRVIDSKPSSWAKRVGERSLRETTVNRVVMIGQQTPEANVEETPKQQVPRREESWPESSVKSSSCGVCAGETWPCGLALTCSSCHLPARDEASRNLASFVGSSCG